VRVYLHDVGEGLGKLFGMVSYSRERQRLLAFSPRAVEIVACVVNPGTEYVEPWL
jgi:hypothetical protein